MGALRYHRSSNYRKQQLAMTRETKGESCSIETLKYKERSSALVLRPLRNGHYMADAVIFESGVLQNWHPAKDN